MPVKPEYTQVQQFLLIFIIPLNLTHEKNLSKQLKYPIHYLKRWDWLF